MSFICMHGHYYSRCEICSEIPEETEEMGEEESDDFVYDYYLNLDEKKYRDTYGE